jgi:DNA-binding NtrC family response regulator
MAEEVNYMMINACPIRPASMIVNEMVDKAAILVIDDEPIVADALMIVLSDSGYEVTVALTGRDGLDKLSEQRFDVTITDLRLPDMSGLEVLSIIREKEPCSLIILITAHTTPEIIAEAVRRGAVDVLSKPFFPSDVLELLEKSLTNRNLKN